MTQDHAADQQFDRQFDRQDTRRAEKEDDAFSRYLETLPPAMKQTARDHATVDGRVFRAKTGMAVDLLDAKVDVVDSKVNAVDAKVDEVAANVTLILAKVQPSWKIVLAAVVTTMVGGGGGAVVVPKAINILMSLIT